MFEVGVGANAGLNENTDEGEALIVGAGVWTGAGVGVAGSGGKKECGVVTGGFETGDDAKGSTNGRGSGLNSGCSVVDIEGVDSVGTKTGVDTEVGAHIGSGADEDAGAGAEACVDAGAG